MTSYRLSGISRAYYLFFRLKYLPYYVIDFSLMDETVHDFLRIKLFNYYTFKYRRVIGFLLHVILCKTNMNRLTVDSVHGSQILMHWYYVGFIRTKINWDKSGRDHKRI